MGGDTTNTPSRALGALLVASLLWIGPVRATSFTTDQSDIWGAANESGWAAEFVQRGSAIFAVIYVYNASGYASWYSAHARMERRGRRSLVGRDLYLTSGPWFGADPYNGANLSIRNVGTMTWTAQSTNAGTLTYSIDKVAVTKKLQRFLLRYDNYAGRYGGGVHRTVAGCADPSLNGTREFAALIEVLQTGLTITVQTVGSGSVCTQTGQLSQAG